jgi:hypothetical protein
MTAEILRTARRHVVISRRTLISYTTALVSGYLGRNTSNGVSSRAWVRWVIERSSAKEAGPGSRGCSGRFRERPSVEDDLSSKGENAA